MQFFVLFYMFITIMLTSTISSNEAVVAQQLDSPQENTSNLVSNNEFPIEDEVLF